MGKVMAQFFVTGLIFSDEFFPLIGEQRSCHWHRARGIEHMDDWAGVERSDFDGGMGGAGGGAAEEQRDAAFGEPAFFHFACDVGHFVEGRCDQPAEADHIGADFDGFIEDFVTGDHDAEVGYFVAVAGEDDAYDVFADVVDVTFDGGDEEPPGGAASFGDGLGFGVGEAGLGGFDFSDVAGEELGFFCLHEWRQVGDCLFHDPGGFDYLGQEHFAGAEEVADDAHAVHERAFDDLEGPVVFLARLLGVAVDEFVDAFEQGVFEPFFDGVGAPREVFLDSFASLAFKAFGEVEQPFGAIGAAVEQYVFDVFEQFFGDLVVDFEHAGIDDAHVHAGLSGVVKKGGVHGFADDVIAAK